jgi:hypothetical protein
LTLEEDFVISTICKSNNPKVKVGVREMLLFTYSDFLLFVLLAGFGKRIILFLILLLEA